MKKSKRSGFGMTDAIVVSINYAPLESTSVCFARPGSPRHIGSLYYDTQEQAFSTKSSKYTVYLSTALDPIEGDYTDAHYV